MKEELAIFGAVAFTAMVVVWALTRTIVTLKWKEKMSGVVSDRDALEREKHAMEMMMKELREADAKALAEVKEQNARAMLEMKAMHDKDLEQELATVKAEMSARTEALLKEREEALSLKAKETFTTISGDLGKNLKDMKDAFDANRKAHLEDSASMKEKFESAVKSLEEQSKEIGGKADNLADALRGQKKMQGCWGETILANLLTAEGLVEGRDFEKEATLRDDLGFTVTGEDSDRRMRPDFLLHLPDDNDIVIDAKVSLSAFSDYLAATDESQKADAARRNLAAVREQVKRLAGKSYERYLRHGHRMLDYVIMFVPNYPALQLAYTEDPKLWREAYAQGVLITSEETLMPFLRMISIAWTNVEQVRNQQQIIAAAQNMIDRVADFSKAHAEMGRKLSDAMDFYDKCSDKLKDSGHSIVQSARQVVKLGVPSNPKKPLPED